MNLRQRLTIILIALVVACIGVYSFVESHAATPYASIEAETGSLSGGATITKDGTASGQESIQFSAPSAVSYSVVGNKILDASGQQYTPSGISIFGLGVTNWSGTIADDLSRITAIASFWHVNTVRIQVQANLVNNATTGYLAAIEQEVNYAEQEKLNVILSAQYEDTDPSQLFPDTGTDQFWKTMAGIYGKDPQVWFDLFNEPQLNAAEAGGNQDDIWNIWKNGGTATTGTYVGMQTIVNDIRATGATNLVIAEGIYEGKSLNEITSYQLSGSNVVYGFHSYLESGFDTPADWATDWGNASATLPVFDDEFGMSEGPETSCQTDAPTLVPTLLAYLASDHIGLVGWTLKPDYLLAGGSTGYTTPSTYNSAVQFVCPSSYVTGSAAQGMGQDLLIFWQSGDTIFDGQS